jgi:deoxyribodipyrimidine photo-lyase
MKKKKLNIFWFRRDMRLNDNVGLHFCLKSELPTLCVFIFDKKILESLPKDDKRVSFIHDTLKNLKKSIQLLGSDLLILHETSEDAFKQISEQYSIQAVYFNEDFEPYAISRDSKIKRFLNNNEIDFIGHKDQYIFSKNDILKNDGTPYKVYTPYKNKWHENITSRSFKDYTIKPFLKNLIKIKPTKLPTLKTLGFIYNKYDFKLDDLDNEFIHNYHETRDIPSLDSTSKLGMHLRFGTVSIRQYAAFARDFNQTWLNELIWREFFAQILYHYPYVEKGPFRDKYKAIKWRKSKKDFETWCQGKTGYALVDAGMRELNATGFMHNRVRMVAASFLIKHLLIDWRWGEKYFAQKLLDFDLASNNGNWQWVAGTGCDAAPYFRIFNPETQLHKFDKDLIYIKKWIPEYGTNSYPEKMVDHKFAYNRALEAYKEL